MSRTEKKFTYDVWGDTVNIASRMEESGIPNKINISNDPKDKVARNFDCIERGLIEAKNKGKIKMSVYQVTGVTTACKNGDLCDC